MAAGGGGEGGESAVGEVTSRKEDCGNNPCDPGTGHGN